MLLRATGLSAVILLAGCAGNNAQMQSNAALIDRLNNRIAVLESQQQALSEQVAAGGARVPTGIMAVPSSRRSGVYDDTPINAAAGMASGGSGTDAAYEQALALYRAGDIGNAVAAFEQYLRQGGSGDAVRLNLARYWLGDAYYTQRQYEQANRFLGQYLREEPNGEKAGMALDKLISSLRAVGRNMDADILSQQGVRAITGG